MEYKNVAVHFVKQLAIPLTKVAVTIGCNLPSQQLETGSPICDYGSILKVAVITGTVYVDIELMRKHGAQPIETIPIQQKAVMPRPTEYERLLERGKSAKGSARSNGALDNYTVLCMSYNYEMVLVNNPQ